MLKIWKCVESAPGQVAIIACRKVEIGTLFRYKNQFNKIKALSGKAEKCKNNTRKMRGGQITKLTMWQICFLDMLPSEAILFVHRNHLLLLLFNCSVVSDSIATPRTVACQASLSMGFLRQDYWSGLPFPFPGDLPEPGIKSASPTWQAYPLPLSNLESPQKPYLRLISIEWNLVQGSTHYIFCSF